MAWYGLVPLLFAVNFAARCTNAQLYNTLINNIQKDQYYKPYISMGMRNYAEEMYWTRTRCMSTIRTEAPARSVPRWAARSGPQAWRAFRWEMASWGRTPAPIHNPARTSVIVCWFVCLGVFFVFLFLFFCLFFVCFCFCLYFLLFYK